MTPTVRAADEPRGVVTEAWFLRLDPETQRRINESRRSDDCLRQIRAEWPRTLICNPADPECGHWGQCDGCTAWDRASMANHRINRRAAKAAENDAIAYAAARPHLTVGGW